eukprot:m.241132 g.241132  ORF g.241132 m.241132 type:complete len:511 (+) comp40200_c0_seq37:91-1623(+)
MDTDSDAIGYVSTVMRHHTFSSLRGIAVLSEDSIAVSDTTNCKIWRVNPLPGGVSLLAGIDRHRSSSIYGDHVRADYYRFSEPCGLFADGSVLFVAERNKGRIAQVCSISIMFITAFNFMGYYWRKVCRGVASTVAGTQGGQKKPQGASFSFPSSIALMPDGSAVVAEKAGVQLIGSDGKVTKLAGRHHAIGFGQKIDLPIEQNNGCLCKDAYFYDLQQIAVGSDGSIYVADRGTKSVQRIKYGEVRTFVKGFSAPEGVAVDGDGNVFVSDTEANRIFKVKPTGEKEVLCGSGKNASEDGQGRLATLNQPHFLQYDSRSGCLLFTEGTAVRKVRVEKRRPSHHDPTFSTDLMKLIDNSNIPSADVIQFRVEGRLIQVAKTNLCVRSEYFQKMLQSGWKESKKGKSKSVIPVEETTYDAFHALITYLVAGVLDVEKCRPIMIDIFMLADKYLEGNLKGLCIRQLVKDLSLETVIDCLFLSEKFNNQELMEASLRFAADHLKDLRGTKGFLS